MLNDDFNLSQEDSPDSQYSISPQELTLDSPEDSTEIATPTAAQQEQPEVVTPVNQFEVDALDILDNTSDYRGGMLELTDYYKNKKFDDPAKAKEILETYGKDIQFKTKEPGLDLKSTIAIAPVKMSEIAGDTPEDRINNWEQANLDKINNSGDPDYISTKHLVTSAISNYASEARREQYDSGTGLLAWGKDAYYRAKEGAISPFAKLAGADEEVKSLHEHTQSKYDNYFPSRLAGAAGFIGPAVAVGAVAPAAVLPILATQSAGEVREAYKNSIDSTGDTTRAIQASLLTGAAQAVNFIPLGRIVDAAVKGEGSAIAKAGVEAVSSLGAKEVEEGTAKTLVDGFVESLDKAKKHNFGNVPLAAIEAGAAGAAGRVIGNYAANIGLDQNGNLLNGTWDDFLVNATLGGAIHGASALRENYTIQQFQKAIKDLDEAHGKVEAAQEPLAAPKSNRGKTVQYQEGLDNLENKYSSMPKVKKDEEGYWRELPKESPTSEQLEADRIFYEKRKEDYVNDPLPDDYIYSKDLTDETGEPVSVRAQPDEVVEDIPENTTITPEEGMERIPSNPALADFARKFIGATVQLRKNIADGAFGSFNTGSNTVNLLKSLGADIEKLGNTFAHEVGHGLDKALNEEFTSNALQTMAEKLKGVKDNWWKDITDSKELNRQAKELSMKWRPGWDGFPGSASKDAHPHDKFRAYRNQPLEQYADVFSALTGNSKYVKDNYSELFNAFEKGLARHPELSSAWSQFQKMLNDPNEMTKFFMQVRYESRKKMGDMQAANALEHMRNNSETAQFIRNKNEAIEGFYNKYRLVRQIASKAKGPAREQMFSALINQKRQDYLGPYYKLNIDTPLGNEVFSPMVQAGIDLNDWAHYIGIQHTINDETNTMVRVKSNPEPYFRAAEWLKKTLLSMPSIKKQMVEGYFNFKNFTNPDHLNNAFAKINIIADVAEVLNVNDFINKHNSETPGDPNNNKKALNDYSRAKAALDKRRESIPMEELRGKVSKLPKGELRTALEDVTREGAFNARRYLINSDGATVADAQRDLTFIRQKLGPEKFAKLEKYSTKFHEILNRTLPDVIESGIFTPDTLERILNNKDTYVNTAVLKYFESARSLDGSIRQATGSFNEIGNEITSTIYKSKFIHERSIYQNTKNNIVKMAKAGGYFVEAIKPERGENVFHLKDELSRSDLEHSYVIDYKDGIPTINKLAGGKSLENSLKRNKDIPDLQLLAQVSGVVNKLLQTYTFKTLGNPVWGIGQKYLDRAAESVFLNSFAPKFGLPIHIFGKGRVIDKATVEELRHYRKTGELTGRLKEFTDVFGAALRYHNAEFEGVEVGPIDKAVIEAFGTKWPKSESLLEKIGQYEQKALDAVGGQRLRDIVEFDELRAKVNGYRIGLEKGQGQAEALNFGQENFGNPDAGSGGYRKKQINQALLFGGAFMNGQRAIAHLVTDLPATAASQITARVVLPKLLMTGIGVAVVRSLLGDDSADKYQKGIDKIPSWAKISGNPILLGFVDDKGNQYAFNDPSIKVSDITNEWKALYATSPQSREITSMSRLIWPMLEGLTSGDLNHAKQGFGQALLSEGLGNFQPAFQYAFNIGEMVFRPDGPRDWFRNNTDIYDKRTKKTGTTLDKAGAYGEYLLAQSLPGYVPYNLFNQGESKGSIDTIEKNAPVVGPLLNKFLQISNYGEIEKSKNAKEQEQLSNNAIEATTSDNVQELLDRATKAAGAKSGAGKEWRASFGENKRNEIIALTSWKAGAYNHARNALKDALSAGDAERYQEILKDLDASALEVKASLNQ